MALDIDRIKTLATEAGITLTSADMRMLERIALAAERIRAMPAEQKARYGIPEEVIPQLKIVGKSKCTSRKMEATCL